MDIGSFVHKFSLVGLEGFYVGTLVVSSWVLVMDQWGLYEGLFNGS